MDWLSLIIVAPLELMYRGLFEVIQIFVKNLGAALLVLSLVTVALMIPLEKCVRSVVAREKLMESILEPQVKDIKAKFKGAEQHAALRRLYGRYRYSPVYSVRSALGVLIQLPFLLGAYWMLSDYAELNGVAFGAIKDLSAPDGLIGGINLLPLVMTAVNLLTVLVSRLERKEQVQAIVIAALFLVLLYAAPSALLLYWTANNVLHLIRALAKRLRLMEMAAEVLPLCLRLIQWVRDRFEYEFDRRDWMLLFMLSALTPACFLWFANIGFFSPAEIASSLWATAVIMGLITGAFCLLKLVCRGHWMRQGFIVLMVFMATLSVYKCSIAAHVQMGINPLIKASVLLAVFYLVVLLGRIRLANVLLAAVLLCSVVMGVHDAITANRATMEAARNDKAESIRLKETPNLYYILCESMNSLDIAKEVYGVNGGEDLRKFLQSEGFYVPDHVYSNSDHTLATLTNLFTMKEKASGGKGTLDASSLGRNLIGGGDGNNLLQLLKDNGYRTAQYFKGETYFYKRKGPLLDVSDINVSLAPLGPMEHLGFAPIIKIGQWLKQHFQTTKIVGNGKVERDYLKIFENDLKARDERPNFFFYHMNFTLHTPSDGSYDYTGAAEWIKSGWYRDRYLQEMEAIKKLTERILANDPDAIIVFCGDHGAWRLRSLPRVPLQVKWILREAGVSYQDYLDDRFKVFAAVRLPAKYGQLNEAFSPANIFAKIFNKIGYEGKPLIVAPNESYLSGFTFLDGAPAMRGEVANDGFLKN